VYELKQSYDCNGRCYGSSRFSFDNFAWPNYIYGFPTVGEEAIMVGAWHRQVLGAAILVFSIYFWFMRDTEKVIAKRFLFASGLCFSLNALVLIKASVIDGVTALPIPPFVILVIFAIASFYVSKKRFF
jgi:hypothetical protein